MFVIFIKQIKKKHNRHKPTSALPPTSKETGRKCACTLLLSVELRSIHWRWDKNGIPSWYTYSRRPASCISRATYSQDKRHVIQQGHWTKPIVHHAHKLQCNDHRRSFLVIKNHNIGLLAIHKSPQNMWTPKERSWSEKSVSVLPESMDAELLSHPRGYHERWKQERREHFARLSWNNTIWARISRRVHNASKLTHPPPQSRFGHGSRTSLTFNGLYWFIIAGMLDSKSILTSSKGTIPPVVK